MRDDKVLGSTIRIDFTTHDTTGALVAPSSAFAASDFRIYKDGSASEKTTTNGITATSPFDSIVGKHLIEIDTSNDTGDVGFWSAGSEYRVEINSAKTVASVVQSGVVLGRFALVAAGVLRPTVDGRTVKIDSNGDVERVVLVDTTTTNTDMRGTDGANTTAPATPTNVTDARDVITARLPAALNAGRMASHVEVISNNAVTAAAIAANAITAAKIATGAFTAAKFAAGAFDAVWDVTNRSLTTFGTLVSDIWSATTRTLTAFSFSPVPSNAADVTAIKAVTDKLDTGLVLDGSVWQFTVNMLELGPSGSGATAQQVWEYATRGLTEAVELDSASLIRFVTEDTGETTAADGSVAKLSQGGGGGDATLAKQEEILAALQGVEAIQVASPNVQGNLVLTQGDSYDGIANPKAQWIVTTDYTDGWSVSLTIRDADDNIAYSTAGAVASATLVTVEIEAPTGLPMTGCPGQWQGKFDVQLSKAGSVKTIALGACYINEDQTR